MKNSDISNIYYKVGIIVWELKRLNRGKAANQPLLSTLWAARLLSTRSGKHLILFANYFMQVININILYFVIIIRPCFNACCKFARLEASSVGFFGWQCWKCWCVGSVGSQEDPAETQQVALLCCFSLFCTMLHVCIESSVNAVLKIWTTANICFLHYSLFHNEAYWIVVDTL